jgi:hypothetical protein
MDQMEDKLGAILNNPQLMGQIMSMAQSLGNSQPPPQEAPPQPNFDPAMLQKLSSLMGQSNIDGNQQALLRALNPYLSNRKVEKLEKAMRAARMARMASGFLGQGGLSALIGR